MNASRPPGNTALLMALVVAAAGLTWAVLTFWPPARDLTTRGESRQATPAARAPGAAPPPAGAGVASAPFAGAPPTPSTQAGGGPTVEVSAGAGSADERQLEKIARGLSVDLEGRLRVSATPEGSVVRLLHLQPGDVLLSVNGQPVSRPEDFARIYREQGLPSQLTLLRGGREIHRH